VLPTNIDVMFSKNILKNFFNGIIIKKKLIASFHTISFLGRPFFFSADASELLLSGLNLEMYSFFKFRYVLYNR